MHLYSFFSVAIQDRPSGVISNYVQIYTKDFLTLSQSTNEIKINCLALENEYPVRVSPNGDEACSSIIKHINASILPNSVTAIVVAGYKYFGVEIAIFDLYFIVLFLLKIILLFYIIKVSKSLSLINRNSTLILFIYLVTILLVDRLGRGSGFYTMDPVLSVEQNLSFDNIFSYFLYQTKSTIFPLLNFRPLGNTVRSVSLLFSGFALKKKEFFLKIRITRFTLCYVAFSSLFPILYLVYTNLFEINIATLNKSLWTYSFFRETPGRIAVYIYTIYLLIFLFYKKDVNAKAVD